MTTAFAIAAATAVLTFATNLDRLADTPACTDGIRQGDSAADSTRLPSVMTEALVADRSLAGVAGGNYFDMAIGGRTITAVTFDQPKGTIGPVILEGRAPRHDHELALGTRTLHAAGLAIGDRVRVKLEEQPTTMRIVGRAVFLASVRARLTPTDLGEGAAMTNTGALKLVNIDTRETNDPDARARSNSSRRAGCRSKRWRPACPESWAGSSRNAPTRTA